MIRRTTPDGVTTIINSGDRLTANPQPPAPAPLGVGDHLKIELDRLGIQSTQCAGGCEGRRKKLNDLGPDGCRELRREILTELVAAYTGWPTAWQAWNAVKRGAFTAKGFSGMLLDDACEAARVDILYIIHPMGDAPMRNGYLREATPGVKWHITTDKSDVPALIRRVSPRLVMVRALYLEAAVFERIVAENPGVNFLSMIHGAVSDWGVQAIMATTGAGHFRTVRDYQNAFTSMPNRRHLPNLKRALCVPNPVVIKPMVGRREPSEVLHVGMSGRFAYTKNFHNQLIALSLLNRTVHCHLVIKDNAESVAEFARAFGMECTVHPWRSRDEFIKWIPQTVNLVMQCNFSETFNFVAHDSLQMGVPVVGSPAIEWLPESLQANPDDPRDIANCIESALRLEPAEARAIAGRVAAENNAGFRAAINRLLA